MFGSRDIDSYILVREREAVETENEDREVVKNLLTRGQYSLENSSTKYFNSLSPRN